MVLISVIRKGAWKRLTLSTNEHCYLAILQIFESTDDVVNYTVLKMGDNFKMTDLYIERPISSGFPKWVKTVD